MKDNNPIGVPRILLVEDELLVALLLEELLAAFDCRVTGVAANIETALELIDAPGAEFDGALLDVNLQGKPVYPVADRLAALHMPFAFVTGYGEDDIEPRHAAAPVLCKPFRPPELAALVASLAIRR